jgi:DNA-binding transcriptional LysR family regulator
MLDDIALFINLYEAKSFRKCAELLNIRSSTVSKHIIELENKLGKELIKRTTRTFEPTVYGTYVYNNLKNLPVFAESILKSYSTKRKNYEVGTLNITLATSISYELVSPYIDEFIEFNKNITLNLNFLANIYKWPSENTNIVLGSSSLNDEHLHNRFLRTEYSRLYCRKEYNLKYGIPETPAELINHKLIGAFDIYSDIPINTIVMKNLKNNSDFLLDTSRVPIRTNNMLHMRKIGLEANYIFGSFDTLVARDIQNGMVIPVLPEWYVFKTDFYLTTKKSLTALEQSFIDFIYRCFSKSYNKIMTNLID